jgi:DNA anti-recombination protein RmuC
MTDVTAQAFREAAEQITRVMCPDTKDLDDAADLLLAAAEQREQVDHVRAVWSTDLKISEARVLTLEIENQRARQQIATLTAERDEARQHCEDLKAAYIQGLTKPTRQQLQEFGARGDTKDDNT